MLLSLPLLYTLGSPLLLWPLKGVLMKSWIWLHITVLLALSVFAVFNLPGFETPLTIVQSAHSALAISFWAPTWSMLFLILIWFIGALILAYAYFYFQDHPDQLKRCTFLLSIFLASMQGLVISENLLLLFIFWELTTLTSFLLIAHYFKQEAARASALRALYLTGAGGLALLFGILLVWYETGSLSLEYLLATKPPLSPIAIALILIGVFTKSAQFPFHFWLPGAMAAPTPISAYLHSATMVKAGLFLFGVFAPLLKNNTHFHLFTLPLILIAGLTAVWGGVSALGQRDLKSLLAYTTVSALGMILLTLINAGTEDVAAAALFILVHALYKGGLFMLIGWVDHTFHTPL